MAEVSTGNKNEGLGENVKSVLNEAWLSLQTNAKAIYDKYNQHSLIYTLLIVTLVLIFLMPSFLLHVPVNFLWWLILESWKEGVLNISEFVDITSAVELVTGVLGL